MKKPKRKICDPCNEKCYSTSHKCPIIVTVSKNYNDDSGCGKPCHVHIKGLNRFPNISTEPRPKMTYKTECDNCLDIIRERDRMLYDKDVEMLQLITDFITLPKNKDDGEKEAIKTHNFKALRELENKLMQKEKEIANMKMRECEEFCYNALREKQLELRWKDFELERLERRPNVIFRNIQKLKHITEKNPEHCFTKLQKRERKLLEREKEIDEALEKLRERKYNEEMAYLEEELAERLKPIVIDTDIECSCECAKYNKIVEEELERQKKLSHDACAYFPIGGYIPFWTCDTMELLKKTAYCPPDFTK